jgi:hypothetical protein
VYILKFVKIIGTREVFKWFIRDVVQSFVKAFFALRGSVVGRSRDRLPVVSLGIISVVPSDKTMCPEVDSASENEYQGFLLG